MKTRHGQTGHVRLGKATGIGGGFLRRRRLWLAVVVSVALLVGLAVVRHFQFRLTARLSHLGKVQADSQAHAQIQAQREAQIEANRIHQEQIRLDNLRNNNINAELSTDDSDSDSNDDNDETVNKPKSPVKLSVPSNILASRFNVPPIPTNSTDNLPSIAYAFLVHSQDSIDSLHESLSLLYHKNDVFIIHLDKKSPQSVFDNLRASYSAFKNIRVIDRQISHESAWASMNLLRAELSLLKSALSFSVDWSLFVLLDGAAFPLQTPLFIKRTLKPVAFSNSAVLFGAFQSLPRHMEFCFSDRESQSS
ncbi:Beta-1,3-galactosyl-O-glycosyl-glycoprotein beta-1,6-N-acetylglucosaminyltransferase, partial [Physocladia obscura]